jgi:mannose-6-phosphate isomerase-like protein (cupin superfamily)
VEVSAVAVRRVVTGHTPEGRAIFVSDGEVPTMSIGDRGSSATLLWGRDEPGHFPDDGSQPTISAVFPPPGGCAAAMMELAPEGDDFHEFVRDGLAQWADPDDAGMHRSATHDYDIVVEGTVGLELDDGVEVTLRPGDFVVLNGTRHRWHNRGDAIARVFAVTVGAYQAVEGGRPV